MSTVTPNFNWPVPTSTDLVKDGATAIEALGDAIDTSMVDLKGGTTGQVLAKASNTDMDFSWVAQDDSNAIQNSIVDAKGDLIAASAADTPARLAVGTNGQVLTADSAEATGLKWATPSSGMTNPMTTTGDTIYSSSGSTPARLPIGTTGQVLTVSGGVPAWASPSGSLANYQLLNAGGTSLTGSNTITISGISGKNSLYVYVLDASATNASSEMYFTLNADTGSNYNFVKLVYNNSSMSQGGGNDAKFPFATIGNSATNKINIGVAQFFGTGSAGIKTYSSWTACNGTAYECGVIGGFYTGTSAVSSISFISSSGNFDNGTIYVYGA